VFGRGVFLKGKNCDSIVIVVPLQVSKFYRVLKKLTISWRSGGMAFKKFRGGHVIDRTVNCLSEK
jgi:hypothetical protein